jgi:hypothetical protein
MSMNVCMVSYISDSCGSVDELYIGRFGVSEGLSALGLMDTVEPHDTTG